MITDKKDLVRYLYAFVLGDGYLTKPEKETYNSQYRIKQKTEHRDYIDWQAEILSSLTSVSVKEYPAYTDSRGFAVKPQLQLVSQRLPFFTRYRNRIYIENVKRVDPHGLKLFDAETAAVWYMDDGSHSYKIRKNGSVYPRLEFCTDSFSFGDCKLLQQVVKEKLDCWGSVTPYRKKENIHYRLYYSGRDAYKLLKAMEPYVLPSFAYKLESLSHDKPLDLEGEEIVRTA